MLDFPHFQRKTGNITSRFLLLSGALSDILSGAKWSEVDQEVDYRHLNADYKRFWDVSWQSPNTYR
jgi:hypothetical protein